jgi:hypothetical protein
MIQNILIKPSSLRIKEIIDNFQNKKYYYIEMTYFLKDLLIFRFITVWIQLI